MSPLATVVSSTAVVVTRWLLGCALMLLCFGVFPAQDGVGVKVKAAGCFIPTPNGVVLTIDNVFRRIRIPFGLRVPGETARETAARETLEETGLDVIVGPLLRTFDNNTALLFYCSPRTDIDDYSRLQPVDTGETAKVIVMDPVTMLDHKGRKIKNAWRFSTDRELLVELATEYKSKETE